MDCLRAALVAFFLVQCIRFSTEVNNDEIQVDGDDFVSFNLWQRPRLYTLKEHTLVLEFKTVNPNGMLVYIGRQYEMGDFLMVDLVRGKLRITVNLGDSIPTSNGHLVLEENLADNHWHIISLSLVGRELNVTHGKHTGHVILQGKYTRFNVEGFVYAGGLPQLTLDVLREYKPSPNLRGCLRYVFFDRWQVLLSPTKAHTTYRVFGSPQQNCAREEFQTLSFQYPDSYLIVHSIGKDLFNVQMRFRSYIANGVLARKLGQAGDAARVSLLEGKVVLDVFVSGVGQLPPLIQGESLNDGEWHDLSVVITKTEMTMKLDQMQELRHENPVLQKVDSFSNKLQIRKDLDMPLFVGCIHDLHIDGKVVELRRKPWSHYVVGKVENRCNISSRCFPNPCRHGGQCIDRRSGGFSCSCQKTFYRGPLCERPIYLRTCQEYKNLGLADDAYCKVDPDTEGPIHPFEVLCNMTGQDQVITLAYHSSVGPQLVSSTDLVLYPYYFHRMDYSADTEGLKALMTQSKSCRQFVSFKCFGSKLLQAPVGPAEVSWVGGYPEPVSVSDYWPGAPAGSMKCACGVNRSCADPRFACNCDIGDKTWREDKGYVTDSAKLPVTSLQFSSSATQSYFTVGPLECFGTPNNGSELSLQAQRDAARFVYSLCRLVNPTVTEAPPSFPPPRHTEQETEPTTREEQEETTLPPTELSTAEEPTVKVTTSQPNSSHVATPPDTDGSSPTTYEYTTQSVSDHVHSESATNASSTLSPTTARPTSTSPEVFTSDLPTNDTQCCGDSNGGIVSFDQDASTRRRHPAGISWQVIVAWVLLIVVVIMFLIVVSYFVKRKGVPNCGLFGVSKKKKRQSLEEEEYGFPEVRMRSRSGELDLSDVRRSIEAGSYNVRTGIIAYGEPFYT